MDIKQYGVVLVSLDPAIGSEIKKTRPCLIISPDEMNRHLRTLIIAPITSTHNPYPSRLPVRLKGKTVSVALDQVRTIDRQCIVKSIGQIKRSEITACKALIRTMLVD